MEIAHELQRLQSFPNVVITAHPAFFTRNALQAIATATLANISDFEENRPCANKIVVKEKVMS
jgi:D-lactate dehydrogenase